MWKRELFCAVFCCLGLCNHLAYTVLKVASGGVVAQSLVHDGKTEYVSVGGRGVAGQGAYALNGARLGVYVVAGGAVAHA